MATATKSRSGLASIGDVTIDAAATKIEVAGHKYPLADGFADFPTPKGFRLTKAPGVGAHIIIASPCGVTRSNQLVGGKLKSTTRHIRKRQQRPLPRPNLWNRAQSLWPNRNNWWVTCSGNHPIFPGLASLLPSGDIEVEVAGQLDQIPYGKSVVGLDVTANNGDAWTLSMSRTCAEFRRRNHFVRARFDGQQWHAFCQLERAQLNVNLEGLVLRPKGATLVVGTPHSFVVRPNDQTCKVHVGKGGLLDVRRDCWVNYKTPSGENLSYVWVDDAWRIASCGPHQFHMHPVFGDSKQSVATGAHGLLEFHLDGHCKIQGSGLTWPDGAEISFSSSDLKAYRPPGPSQLLVITDASGDEVAAQYAPSIIAEQTEWYCGYLSSEPTTYLSPTPILLAVLAAFAYFSAWMILHGGFIPWLALVMSWAQFAALYWLLYQGFRLCRFALGDAISAIWRAF